MRIIPTDEIGRKPSRRSLLNWIEQECWRDRKNEMDSRAIEKVSNDLVLEKADMFKLQYRSALEIAGKAKQHILSGTFDNSSSAVNAYFKATEEQRTLSGISDVFEKVSKMKNDELAQEIRDLLSKSEEENKPE